MNTQIAGGAAALLLLASAGSANAALITSLPAGTALSFAGAFDSQIGTGVRDYDGFEFAYESLNSNTWTSGPSYNYGPNGVLAGPVMALNSFQTATFRFTFDEPVSAVLAKFNWNPCCQSNTPLRISIFGKGDQLLETATLTGAGASNAPGYYGFGERAGSDIAYFEVFGSIFGVADMSIDRAASATPEPATWAMMLMGFFGLGGALRASRRRTAIA